MRYFKPIIPLIFILFPGMIWTSQAQNMVLYKFIGMVSSQEEAVMDAEVRVFDKNEVLSTSYTDKKGKFEIQLIRNGEYTVEISKEGYYPKRILFITRVEESVKKLPTLKFDVELTNVNIYKDIEESNPQATFILDFPSIIIEYDDEWGGFTHREAYTRHITDEIKKIRKD